MYDGRGGGGRKVGAGRPAAKARVGPDLPPTTLRRLLIGPDAKPHIFCPKSGFGPEKIPPPPIFGQIWSGFPIGPAPQLSGVLGGGSGTKLIKVSLRSRNVTQGLHSVCTVFGFAAGSGDGTPSRCPPDPPPVYVEENHVRPSVSRYPSARRMVSISVSGVPFSCQDDMYINDGCRSMVGVEKKRGQEGNSCSFTPTPLWSPASGIRMNSASSPLFYFGTQLEKPQTELKLCPCDPPPPLTLHSTLTLSFYRKGTGPHLVILRSNQRISIKVLCPPFFPCICLDPASRIIQSPNRRIFQFSGCARPQ